MKFKNKVVLITWASKWIWRATALYFWKEWASVVVNYLNSEESAFKVVDAIKKMWSNSISIKWDVSDENQVVNMVNESIKIFWKIDILINNAWVIINKPIFDKNLSDWNNVINTNLLWTYLCSKYYVESMINKWWGLILNLSSVNWTKYFSPDEIEYDISKAWIIALTKNFAKAFSPKFRIFAIAPWNVNTNINNNIWEDDLGIIYSKRFSSANEIWKIIVNLCSDDFLYVNWETIFIDGWWD